MRVETVGGTGAQENVVFLRRRKEFCAERIGQGPYCTIQIQESYHDTAAVSPSQDLNSGKSPWVGMPQRQFAPRSDHSVPIAIIQCLSMLTVDTVMGTDLSCPVRRR